MFFSRDAIIEYNNNGFFTTTDPFGIVRHHLAQSNALHRILLPKVNNSRHLWIQVAYAIQQRNERYVVTQQLTSNGLPDSCQITCSGTKSECEQYMVSLYDSIHQQHQKIA